MARLKTGLPATVTRVRIPSPPPSLRVDDCRVPAEDLALATGAT